MGGCMPIGNARGFGYLGLLFFVAITAAALAALGQAWSTAAQRERERELEFRGGEIARAIASYAKVAPDGAGSFPHRLEDLLKDGRGPKLRYHLRRLYPDPFTGRIDWMLLPEAGQPGSFNGVRSRADSPLLREVTYEGIRITKVNEWLFFGNDYERREGPVKEAPVVPVTELQPSPSLPVAPGKKLGEDQ